MATAFAEGVFAAKTSIFQPRERRMASHMRWSERLPAEVIRRHQLIRGMKVAKHAFESTRFYRALYSDAGFVSRDFDFPSNFDQLPFLKKSDIRRAGADLSSGAVSDKHRLRSVTGGSTGEPLVVFNDARVPTASLWWRAYGWWGLSPADDVAHIYRKSRSRFEEFAHKAEWWPTRHLLLNARGMNSDSMRAFADQWRKTKPALLNGYVDGIHEFAQFLINEDVHVPRTTAVAVTASVLLESQRTFIEKVMHAPVFDCYRSAEIPWIAAQCEQRDGLHVMADARVVEIVDDDGSPAARGDEGEIAITDLWNTAFPLIRYRMGDRSTVRDGGCRCGRTLPVIEAVQGRVVDVLRTPDGQMVTGGYGGLFNRWPQAVTQFQIRQLFDYSVELICVAGESKEESARAISTVRDDLAEMLEGKVAVTVRLVDRIEHFGGKARLVVSDVGDAGR